MIGKNRLSNKKGFLHRHLVRFRLEIGSKSSNQSIRLLARQTWDRSAIIIKMFIGQFASLIDQAKAEVNREYRSYKINYQDQIQTKNNLGLIVFAFSTIFVGLVIIGSLIGYLIFGDPVITAGLIMISIPLFIIGSVFAYLINRASR